MAHMNPASRRGKGKIKPPRKTGPENNTDELWNNLSTSIKEIHNHNASNLSFEVNYRYAYNLVLYRQGDRLYNGVKQLIVENLDHLAETNICPSFPTSSADDKLQKTSEGERLLKAIRDVWDDHIGSMSKLRDLLKYMDRVHTSAARVPMIFEAGLQLFIDRIVRSTTYPIPRHMMSTLLTLIQVERDGYTINQSSVKSCLEVLMELKNEGDNATIYKRDFEPKFLEESTSFYKLEGENLMDSCDAPEYLRRVDARFASEIARTQYYLASATETPLINILKDHLLAPHLEKVVNMESSGLDAMIDKERLDDLGRMFRLCALVPNGNGLSVLRKALKESILRRGKEVNSSDSGAAADQEAEDEGDDDATGKGKGKAKETSKDKERPKRKPKPTAPPGGAMTRTAESAIQWVQNVLDLKDRFDKLLKDCFDNDIAIQSTLNEAFSSFINSNPKAPEYISLFIDENLRKGLKGKTDHEVDVVLDKTITVFRFISNRDIFELYYKSHLSKRLLQGRSVSDDAERGMLAKLKIECGFQFTQKLEGMFNDIKISDDHMSGYKDHLIRSSQTPPVEISVNVLTSTFWPISSTPAPCVFPPELSQACEVYQRYYLSRHSGRRLTWQPAYGNADVKVAFKNKKHDLNVSTYALVILLLFENLDDEEILTYEEIKGATMIDEAELQRNLQSLACAKFKILKKHPPGRDVSPLDSFSFNHDFTSPMHRIKINTISSKVESFEQRKDTMDKVDEERKYQIDASIVRVMKDRKKLSHNELMTEVTKQLASRFQPVPIQIKKRIEALIEREYLDRGDDTKSYIYKA